MDPQNRPIPEAVMDYWLRKLTPHEFRMLIYVLQRTYCVRVVSFEADLNALAVDLRTTPGIVNLDLDGLLSENLINVTANPDDHTVAIALREWIFLNRFPDGWDDN